MRIRVSIFLIASICSLCAQDSPTESLIKAKQLYYSGVGGNTADLSRSAALFESLPQTPNHPEIGAYRGSLLLIEAGRTSAVWKKSSLSKRGLEELDQSVASNPGNLEIRFIRAATTIHLPWFFQRRSQGCEDFRFIAPKASDAAAKQTLDPRIAAAALFMYAKNCATDSVLPVDQAMLQAAAVAPDSPAGQAAKSELANQRNQPH